MKYIRIIILLAVLISCSKNTEKTDTIDITDTADIQKKTETTEMQNAAETKQIPEVQDIFETDIFAQIPAAPLDITEKCTLTELSDVEVFSLDEKSGMKASVSGIYDSVILAESEKFTALYTVYKGSYKLCHAAFFAPVSFSEKWSGYIGTPPYDVLAAFGTPYEIMDTVPALMLYKKDVWVEGDGLSSMNIAFYYENSGIQKTAVWKQR